MGCACVCVCVCVCVRARVCSGISTGNLKAFKIRIYINDSKVVTAWWASENTDSPVPAPQVDPDWLLRHPTTCPQSHPQTSSHLKQRREVKDIKLDYSHSDSSYHISLRDGLPIMHQGKIRSQISFRSTEVLYVNIITVSSAARVTERMSYC